MWTFMLIATALVVVRSLLLAWLAWRQQRALRRRPPVRMEKLAGGECAHRGL
jgi:hypothetical protein